MCVQVQSPNLGFVSGVFEIYTLHQGDGPSVGSGSWVWACGLRVRGSGFGFAKHQVREGLAVGTTSTFRVWGLGFGVSGLVSTRPERVLLSVHDRDDNHVEFLQNLVACIGHSGFRVPS